VATKEELLQRIQDGDEDAIEELSNLITGLEGSVASAARDLKLKTDKAWRDRYPRALRAFDIGKLNLGSVSDDDLAAALEDKENELAELGVPLETSAEVTAKKEEEVPVKETEPADDPAKALGGGVGNTSPVGAPRDEVHEVLEGLRKGSTRYDQAKAFAVIAELNKGNRKDKVMEITKALEARRIGDDR
jgi:hypothetical protein